MFNPMNKHVGSTNKHSDKPKHYANNHNNTRKMSEGDDKISYTTYTKFRKRSDGRVSIKLNISITLPKTMA